LSLIIRAPTAAPTPGLFPQNLRTNKLVVRQGSLQTRHEPFQNIMNLNRSLAICIFPLILACIPLTKARADEFQIEPGYINLFNGRDLTGWGYRTNNFDGKTHTDDGRYSASNGILVVHPREPRLVQQLWTTRQFPNDFHLKLEFRAAVNADSGLFLRGPQLQVRDYLVAGPYKQLKKYKPQDWNEIEVTVKDGVAHCTCNGEVLEETLKLPASGGIGLEGDRGQMEYRRIRLKETR
jgi:hypothetical protein